MRVSAGADFEMPVPSVRLAFSGAGADAAVTAADRVARLVETAPRGVRLAPTSNSAPAPSLNAPPTR
jgi:hypothetical protein